MIGQPGRVGTGLDVLGAERFARLRGARVALISNQSAVDRGLRHAIDVLHRAPGVELRRLFGPEHGLRGEAQDMEGVDSALDRATGLPIVSLYGDGPESLRPRLEQLEGLDTLIFDVQDVGSRYYTFAATLFYAMDAAARANVAVLVLDRPNPIGGLAVEGPSVRPGFESFVGGHPMPIRHGLTVGELARLYRADRNLGLELDVVPCEGWERGMFWRETGLPWVLPSPNMPTPETAMVYPGGCLIEGTNLSEGRGTTLPFELWGAPWLLDAASRFIGSIGPRPGVVLRPCSFRPKFQKHANSVCYGVQPHVTDPSNFSALELYTLLLLEAMHAEPDRFDWRTEPYEFVSDPMAIDLLYGSDRERLALEEASTAPRINHDEWLAGLRALWQSDVDSFRLRRQPALLY